MQLRGHHEKKFISFIIKIFYKDLAEIKSTPVDIRPLSQATDVSIFSAESGMRRKGDSPLFFPLPFFSFFRCDYKKGDCPLFWRPFSGGFLSGSRMAFLVNFQKVLQIKMGILLGGAQALVAEELLDHPQICAAA